ncbi:MAG: pectin acetylesterase-family hydrolase [Acidimicrobiaceae bacterium]|nr:pectin acetylesterase-family hydrolase [Acidimicrobiaceae bacterium]
MAKRARALKFRVGILLLALGLVAASCGGDDAEESEPADTPETTSPTTPATTGAPTTTSTAAPATASAATTTTSATTTTTTTTLPPAGLWEQVSGGDDCRCADGSDYSFWVREADPERVVFYLEGGGACFTAESCSFTDGTYSVTTAESDNPTGAGGIFDFSNPANPLAGSSFVGAPYCTGDVHIGNSVQQYSEDLTVHHNGFANASKALAELHSRFPDATEIVVAGSSAGSVAAPFFGGLASDLYPGAKVSVVADASGAYPSNPVINATIGSLWGAFSVVPDWPVNEGITPAEWGVPEMFIQAGLHDPDIRFARFDNAFDSTQLGFAELAGFDASNMDQLIRDNEAKIEEAGVAVSSYLAPGADHTILGSDTMYTLAVEGVAFIDWLTEYLAADEPIADVSCVDCA